jgi:hypothetical protein
MAEKQNRTRVIVGLGGATLALCLLLAGRRGRNGTGWSDATATPATQPHTEQVEVWLRSDDRIELDGVASNLATTIIRARAAGRANVYATGDARTGFVGEVINALRAAGVMVWADASLFRDADYVQAHQHRNAAPRPRGKQPRSSKLSNSEPTAADSDEPLYAWQRGLDMEESRRLAQSLNQAAHDDEARREAARLNAKPPPELRASVSVDGTRIIVDTEANTGAANAAWRALRAANLHIWDTEGPRITIVGRDSGNNPRVEQVRGRTLDVLRAAGFDVEADSSDSMPELRNAAARPRTKLPRYDERRGLWRGGDSRTLYAFTSLLTGVTWVVPGQWTMNYGPQVTVRVATRDEAEEHWQRPLHRGWIVTETAANESPRNAAGEPPHVAIFRRVADEKFATLCRNELVSTSTSVQGAIASAPARGDVVVRGEYTSDGTHWGLGRGRLVAQRENGRWTMG